jgi:hypothetical protein
MCFPKIKNWCNFNKMGQLVSTRGCDTICKITLAGYTAMVEGHLAGQYENKQKWRKMINR